MINQKIVEFIEYLPEDERSKFVDRIPGMGANLLHGKHYTYFLMRPDGSVFYVGKGKGYRIDAHEQETRRGGTSHKCNIIRKIWTEGGQVIKHIVAYFDNEDDAYRLEVLLIKFFGRENLANGTDGGIGAPKYVSTTGMPNGRPPASLDGKTKIDMHMKDVPVDVIEKLDRLRTGNQTRKDILVRIVREYEHE